jgi:NADH dehydrogenase (ubiquinone) 1 beta subcomplex subunit 8
MWSPDQHKTSGPSAMLQLATAFAAVGLFAYGLSLVRPERPVSKRSYPFGGLEAELGGHNAARKESEEDEE